MKKLISLVLALVMVLAMGTAAFAQEVNAGVGTATITVSNASKGVTYKVYKLFDATVTGTDGGSIAYTGEIPASLKDYFTADEAGNISLADGADTTALFEDLKTWANNEGTPIASAESDGSELKFVGLPYGYYVVTTSQGAGAITVTSTNPNATIVDKNSTPPVGNLTKTADDKDVNVGDTVTYTVKFNTANYTGAGESAKQIVSYTITDTLPVGVTLKEVTSITIGGVEYKVDDAVPQFVESKITIPWVDAEGNNLYTNGAEIVITYTVTVNDQVAIDGAGNTNKVEINYKDEDGNDNPPGEYTAEETIYSYAIALKKVDQSGKELAGATFQLPFYVKATPDADGAYIYAGTAAGEGLVNTLTTPADGLIIIKGVQTGTYSITETKAPNGYNKLTEAVEINAVKTGETTTSTTTYLDKDGNVVDTETTGGSTVLVTIDELAATPIVVVNKTGAELPSTGGMGTTMMYIAGGLLVAAAVVLLITKRRMNAAE